MKHYDDDDIRLVDPEDPFGDDTGQKKKPAKKLFGTTDLQIAALNATGRGNDARYPGFSDNRQLKRFQAIEEFAAGMDPESRMWRAWILFKIAQTVPLNKPYIKVPLDELMRRIEAKKEDLDRKRVQWFNDNRERVLNPKGAQAIAADTGIGTMAAQMEKKTSKKKYED